MLRELNNISQQAFLKSGEEVLVESPKSNIVLKPTANEEKSKKTNNRKESKRCS